MKKEYAVVGGYGGPGKEEREPCRIAILCVEIDMWA
jgi:hypothetical protein